MLSGYYSGLVRTSTSYAKGIFVHVLENRKLVIGEIRLTNPKTGKFTITSVTAVFFSIRHAFAEGYAPDFACG